MQKVQLRWKALGFIVTSGAGGTNGKRETEIRDLNSLGVCSAKGFATNILFEDTIT